MQAPDAGPKLQAPDAGPKLQTSDAGHRVLPTGAAITACRLREQRLRRAAYGSSDHRVWATNSSPRVINHVFWPANAINVGEQCDLTEAAKRSGFEATTRF